MPALAKPPPRASRLGAVAHEIPMMVARIELKFREKDAVPIPCRLWLETMPGIAF